MKKLVSIVLLLTVPISIYSQENDDIDTLNYDTRLYLETNINFATSASDTRSDAQAGTGTFGLKFERKVYYGAVRFTVYSKDTEAEASMVDDMKIFGSNLLIPSSTANSISSFSFLFGRKNFLNLKKENIKRSFIDWSRFGAHGSFAMDKTVWISPENTIDVLINSWDLVIDYHLLTLDFEDENNGTATLAFEFGYTARRLGGDYGLSENQALRFDYIGTDELGFDSLLLGARLEVADFYGEVRLTNFGDKGIPGFSGNQAVINLGFNAQLNLRAKERYETE